LWEVNFDFVQGTWSKASWFGFVLCFVGVIFNKEKMYAYHAAPWSSPSASRDRLK
jgi:hypothetical protein